MAKRFTSKERASYRRGYLDGWKEAATTLGFKNLKPNKYRR